MKTLRNAIGRSAPCHREAVNLPPMLAHRHGRRACVLVHARKGFGATLPKLPSFGKGGPKPPTGGVLPSAPVDLSVPDDVQRLWSESQAQWRQYSIDHPVLLQAHGAQVHLVPVGADLPGDAALIRDVVAAVQPDAIALESPPQHLKTYTSFAKALEPQLNHLLSAELLTAGPTAARTCLSQTQREQLQTALLAAARSGTVKPEPEQLTYLFRLGSLPFAEWLTPAHLVRNGPNQSVPQAQAGASKSGTGAGVGLQKPQQLPMLLVSCGLDKEARAAASTTNPYLGREFDLYLEEMEAALGDEVWGEIMAWRTMLGDRLEAAGAGREAAVLLTTWEAQCCLGPEQQREVEERVVERMRTEGNGNGGVSGGDVALEVVRTPADPWVAKRLVELAAGKNVVRPCQRIVAVVGRVHLLSVQEELRKLATEQGS